MRQLYRPDEVIWLAFMLHVIDKILLVVGELARLLPIEYRRGQLRHGIYSLMPLNFIAFDVGLLICEVPL